MLFATSLLIIGLILLVYGADRLVYSAAVLSRSLGVAPWLIGCTIVAFGTSLPELLVSVTAALNNQIDMAVGNILGSNIINIMLIVGSAAFIRPVTLSLRYSAARAAATAVDYAIVRPAAGGPQPGQA